MTQAPMDPLSLLLVIWLMLNGFAALLGIIHGDPVRKVKSLNMWLFRGVRKLISGILIWCGKQVAPKKKGRRP